MWSFVKAFPGVEQEISHGGKEGTGILSRRGLFLKAFVFPVAA
jgi:hypothetical protein